MDLRIYCSWCNDHAFKIDKATAVLAGMMVLTCPGCRRDTRVSLRSSLEVSVLPSEQMPLSQDDEVAKEMVSGSLADSLEGLHPLEHLDYEPPPTVHDRKQRFPIAGAAATGVAVAGKGRTSFSSGPGSSSATPASDGDDSSRLPNSRIPDALAPDSAKKWTCNPVQLPWYDQSNALELLERRRIKEKLSDEEYKLLRQWATDGYCVVSGIIQDSTIDSMMADFENLWTADRPFDGLQFFDLPLGPSGSLMTMCHAELLKVDKTRRLAARDNSNWRINHFDAYSAAANSIFENSELTRLTSLIFGCPSVPDSTLSFMYGSAQDAHQDTAVFHVFPPNYIIGAWIACEDISPDSGPLMFYPGSHLEPIFEKFDNYPQTNLRTAGPQVFQEYKAYMERLTRKYDRHLFIAKKGEILLWHGMLLHGGCEIKNPKLTRKSYVIHYFPPGMNVGNDVVGPFNW